MQLQMSSEKKKLNYAMNSQAVMQVRWYAIASKCFQKLLKLICRYGSMQRFV